MASSKSKITVAVMGYDPLRLIGLRSILESQAEFSIRKLDSTDFSHGIPGELVLLGSQGMTSVYDTIAVLRDARPETKIILTSATTSDEAILRSIAAGVRGYLDEAAPPEEYKQALRTVHSGLMWAPPRVLSKFIESVTANPKRSAGDETDGISDRERQVLELLVAGLTNKEIGAELGIEERTVKAHISKLMQKAGVGNRIALSVHALTHSLLGRA